MSKHPVIKSRKIEITYNIPIGKTLRFWDGLKDGKILATKCRVCGRLYFPPTADCRACYSSEIDWVELSGEGVLVAYTHVAVRPVSFQQEQPYTVGIAELKEGVKALAWLEGLEQKEIKIGVKVKLTPKSLPDGRFTFVFTKPKEE